MKILYIPAGLFQGGEIARYGQAFLNVLRKSCGVRILCKHAQEASFHDLSMASSEKAANLFLRKVLFVFNILGGILFPPELLVWERVDFSPSPLCFLLNFFKKYIVLTHSVEM